MQAAPLRLSLAIRHAFQASKPIHRNFISPTASPRASPACTPRTSVVKLPIRGFADRKDVDKSVEEITSRIDSARVDAGAMPKTSTVSQNQDRQVASTPSPSSHESRKPGAPPEDLNTSSLPSSVSAARSHLSKRFSHVMDNVQSNIFVASQRLNDLTGYSGIEALKKDIQQQEEQVMSTKKAVKEQRDAYAAAVATRATTQREVNDLLHRKHGWTPADLERFTNLYRSDHANEQAEAEAQELLGRVETLYEEASNKLGTSILARYHEEQIWSDKIRQMSTWGTWGLMGLNVLLFIVFQIMIEPWRRRRLVKGFEEKVHDALKVQQEKHESEKEALMASAVPDEDSSLSGSLVAMVVDSITGSTESSDEMAAEESAIEQIVNAELQAEHQVEEAVQASTFAVPSAASGYAYYEEAFRELFSEKQIVLTQKELTTVAIEGACGGAAIVGLLLVLLRPR